MSRALPRPSAKQRFRSLVDALIESWVSWRESCEDVRSAYHCWGQCKAAQRALAFASYCAALEREDQAARVYLMHVERVREVGLNV
jgi:hypothetical protein